ncbi:hypothetical protein C1H46_018798 [Malus baccata]|uniref:PGG domain-containing protein n=1 Tax=Malus baccata TaxID=106549 RepID=A0A540MA70_MALBA|nr:hypothetical protein C1H46_018798 [Malus baccata]
MDAMNVEESRSSLESASKLLKYFQYNPQRDSATDVRSVLLVVAALIAAATFTAGVNPPGGVWQETDYGKANTKSDDHLAGRSVLATTGNVFAVFLFFNSAAFSSSIIVISYLVYNFPFYLEIWIAMASMTFTYSASIVAITDQTHINSFYMYLALILPFILRSLVEGYKKLSK